MAKRDSEYKRLELLFKMLIHYLDRPYSDVDLGVELGTHDSNVWRIRRIMADELEIPIQESTERGKYFIRKDFQMRYIHFSPEEMAALYLAARQLQQQTKTSQEPVELALRKLANALHKPFAESLVKAASVVKEQEQDAQQQAVFSLLIKSWLEKTPVRIYHHVLHGTRRDYVVHPYHIEPSVWGDGNYLIGYSEYHKKIARFKIARIEKVVQTGGPYREQTDFDVQTFLKYAWGIWSTDAEPVTVKLRFGKRAVPRLQESHWPQARLYPPAADGSHLWEIQVGEWREMVPWVQSWGGDVLVIEPTAMHNRLKREAERLARLYGITAALAGSGIGAAIAHTANTEGERHDLLRHLQAVAEMAAAFAQPFGGGELARCLGLWHDVGKFHPAFQTYLLQAEEEPNRKQRGPDHKAAGAMFALQQKLPFANLLIQGHHGGLRNKADFDQWYADKKDAATEAIALARQASPDLLAQASSSPQALFPLHIHKDPYAAEFFVRFVFSALTDADFLDTERHFTPERADLRSKEVAIDTLWQRLAEVQQQFIAGAAMTPVNQLRQEIYAACLDAAIQRPGLFRLTVPTGGGKTRSGLAFALRHAQQHGLRRVIVAVPFLTITEQTVAVYRDLLEREADLAPVVLEHHSGAIEEMADGDFAPDAVWNRLAAENWDAPVIVTTTVQLFESLFANSPTRCRKLHRLAGSVIVLDEAQALPVGLLNPILSALRELCAHYGSTVVLSTATQPAFDYLDAFRDLPATEIIPEPARYFTALSRVTYDWRLQAKQSWAEVASWMQAAPQVLAIVNTKKDALALLAALADPQALHLSTLLCGAHRRDVVAEIKRRLTAGEPCRLVATQVVEAGVDIDFPLVLRAFGPLDSIIQAAGRANREGKLPGKGQVVIFDPAEGGAPRGSYQIAKETTRTFLHDGPPDMDDPAAVAHYFRLYYPLDNQDRKEIQKLRKAFDYPEVARAFRMIDDDTVNVVVEYAKELPEIHRLVEQLRNNWGSRRTVLRRLQPYMVALRRRQAQAYQQQGFITPVLVDAEDRLLVGHWLGRYDPVYGLTADDLDADQLIV